MSERFTPPIKRQRGAALLLAMIIVTLISTLAVSLIWQQWRAVQVEGAERARAQSAWILNGALDWASLILREDNRFRGSQQSQVDHLGEPWAVPLAEARLSTFLAADKQSTDDGPEAFLSGGIVDAQSRFNIYNLVDGGGTPVPAEVASLQRLCENLNISSSTAVVVAQGLQAAHISRRGSPGAVANPPLWPRRISQLAWLGVDPQALARLEPFVTMLEANPATKVNINTAAREVIAAVVPNVNVGDAERLVQHRVRSPFRTMAEIKAQLSGVSDQELNRAFDVKSDFFEVRGRLRLADRTLEQRSLVRRVGTQPVVVLSSERVTSNEGAPVLKP